MQKKEDSQFVGILIKGQHGTKFKSEQTGQVFKQLEMKGITAVFYPFEKMFRVFGK